MVFNPRAGQPGPNTVGVTELQDGAVSPIKLSDGAGASDAQAANVNFSHTGLSRKRFERYEFYKDSGNKRNLKSLRIYHDLKADGTNQATLEIWLDNDGDWNGSDIYTGAGVADGKTDTISASFIDGFIDLDISGLANGKHVVNMAMLTNNAAGTADTTIREYILDKSN